MKNFLFNSVIIFILLPACKENDKSKEDPPISALSIIKGQLQELDTSLYQIKKIEITDDKPDTVFIKREDIRNYAAPFLELPDIANDDYYENYAEDRLIDAEQQTLSITSTAKEDAELQKQIIIVNLADISSGKIQSIYIDRYKSYGDSTIEQKLFWEVDKSFSVSNIIQKGDRSEKTHRVKVEWQ